MANEYYPDRPVGSTFGGTGTGTDTTGIKDRVTEAAHEAKVKAAEWSRTAVDKIDQGRQSAAGALDSTASGLRSSGDKVANAATVAAAKIESTANYMRGHDVRNMMSEMESTVRSNPGPSLLAAVAVGFLLGTALRK